MDFQLTVQSGPTFVLIVCSGRATLSDLLVAVVTLGVRTSEVGQSQAFLDLLAVDTQLTVDEHITLGRRAASAWGHLRKVACTVPADLRVGVGEEAARGDGLNLRTFTTIAAALAWLAASE